MIEGSSLNPYQNYPNQGLAGGNILADCAQEKRAYTTAPGLRSSLAAKVQRLKGEIAEAEMLLQTLPKEVLDMNTDEIRRLLRI